MNSVPDAHEVCSWSNGQYNPPFFND
jgi:hypothetical protein